MEHLRRRRKQFEGGFVGRAACLVWLTVKPFFTLIGTTPPLVWELLGVQLIKPETP
jgi:hypothetical protein